MLVTTSFVDQQAYREIKEDEHLIVVVAARDIVDVLRSNGWADRDTVTSWLRQEFPIADG